MENKIEEYEPHPEWLLKTGLPALDELYLMERLRIGKKVSKYLAYKLEKYEPHYVFSDDEHIWVTPDHLVEEMYMLIENVKLLRKTQCSHGNDPY